jgi:hypothetical protein
MAKINTPVAEAAPVEATVTTEVETNFIVEDNTTAPSAEERPVEVQEVELMNGFTQVNYL